MKMATIFLILFVTFVNISSMCHAQRTAVGRLNTTVKKLNRKTDSLEKEVGAIWKEVDDIWTAVSESGTMAQNYNNRTRTDGLGNTRSQNLKTNKNDTVNTIQDLKDDVEHLMLTSRNGFKNEKTWQREAIRNITGLYEDFKAGVTTENQKVIQDLERVDTELVRINESCNFKLETINTELNERTNETWNELEHVRTFFDNLSENQNKLETESQALSQTITEMKNDYQDMENEYQALSQTIVEMQSDYQEVKNENQALSQIIVEMQTELTKVKASLPCDEGWRFFHGYCYLVVKESISWDDASAYCENINSYLVEIITDAEREFAEKLLRDYGGYEFWIGATDRDEEGTFLYQHSKQLVPRKYWYKGEPNNKGGSEDCVHMSRSYGVIKLNDTSCRNNRYFVCEKP